MATEIKFGTSGWRAVMAEEFTFANVRRAVNGIARHVASRKASGARVIVGRDPRFLGETFCAMAVEILVSHGITPLLIGEPAPTPAIAYAVMHEHADGAALEHELAGLREHRRQVIPRAPENRRGLLEDATFRQCEDDRRHSLALRARASPNFIALHV